jgi:Na+-translocating ferredoxin:NAD+ oxidoreductase RnfD subunit
VVTRICRNDVALSVMGLALYLPAIGRYGWRLEVLLVLSLLIGLMTEYVAARLTKRPLGAVGLPAWILLPLVMPPALPLWMSGLSLFFAAVFCVAFFGGYGRHPVAPVAVGWAFARLSFTATFGFAWSFPFPHPLAGFVVANARLPTVDHPLVYLADGAGVSLPAILMGAAPSSPAMAFPLLLLLGGVLLLLLRVTSGRTCLGFLGSYLVLQLLVPSAAGMPVAKTLVTGDLLFAAFLVLSDQRVSARTYEGRWLIGILAGGAAFLIRHFATYPDGVFFAVIVANIFTPIIDEAVLAWRRREVGA